MKKEIFAFAAAISAVSALADANDPQIQKVGEAMQDLARVLTVNYTLDEPAIVTFDMKTNGVSIGAENLKLAYGDVHRVVEAGTRSLSWPAYEAWPGYKFNNGEVSVEVTAWATNSPPDYMVIKLVGEDKGARTFYTAPEQLPGVGGVTNDMYKTDYLVMRRIPAAGKTYRMGSPTTEVGRDYTSGAGEEPLHYVCLTNDFYISVFELTQGQYTNALGRAPNNTTKNGYQFTATHPVNLVTYSSFSGTDLPQFRNSVNLGALTIPTEAEWEFACRAGTLSARYDGSEYPADVSHLAWYGHDWPQDVGLLQPNGFGLYDMIGNVPEVCLDDFVSAYAEVGSTMIAPRGSTTGGNRVLRGGQLWWAGDGYMHRSAWRYPWGNGSAWMLFGYRLVCTF